MSEKVDPEKSAAEQHGLKRAANELVPVVEALLLHYTLPLFGDHGVSHWARVLENGHKLAGQTGANLRVVSLFAVLHDAKRLNECSDPEHGPRAADAANELHGTVFSLEPRELVLLDLACRYHTVGRTHDDVTIQTCWDSDRLDLGRVGITPDPARLCTAAARDRGLLEWADERAFLGFAPAFVSTIWGLDFEKI